MPKLTNIHWLSPDRVTGFKYTIGSEYRYPNSEDVLKLKKVKGYIFTFECGHWCTDCVFMDLIEISNKKQQLELELEFN
jgi:hypothetical protein